MRNAKTNTMETIILNSNNCKEYSNEEFKAKMIETAHQKAKKEIAKKNKAIKVVGWKSEEGRKLIKEVLEIEQNHKEKYGEEAFYDLRLGKKNSAASFKLQNSKGNGYGK